MFYERFPLPESKYLSHICFPDFRLLWHNWTTFFANPFLFMFILHESIESIESNNVQLYVESQSLCKLIIPKINEGKKQKNVMKYEFFSTHEWELKLCKINIKMLQENDENKKSIKRFYALIPSHTHRLTRREVAGINAMMGIPSIGIISCCSLPWLQKCLYKKKNWMSLWKDVFPRKVRKTFDNFNGLLMISLSGRMLFLSLLPSIFYSLRNRKFLSIFVPRSWSKREITWTRKREEENLVISLNAMSLVFMKRR